VKPSVRSSVSVAATIAALLAQAVAPAVSAATTTQRITFPIVGPTSFSDDFGDPRVGHTHQGNDVFGRKGQSLVAAADGVVQWVVSPQRGAGLGFAIQDADGYAYWYLHVNNDAPGTDDGTSSGVFAYAPDLYGGNPVVAGQLLGWLGDSGNAERTSPHLHFEIHNPSGKAFNPYTRLVGARRIAKPVTPPALPGELLPYGQFTGGASLALGNVDAGTPERELVTAAGPGGGPQVRVFGVNFAPVAQFYAFEATFRGGVDVATGDVDGDGTEEVIVGPGRGRLPEVRVFTARGEQRLAFTAYAPSFRGGIRVAAADLDGDGRAEIVTGPRRGGGPNVKAFDGLTGSRRANFFAYGQGFRGGIDVAAYPAGGGQPGFIVTAAGAGGGPHVRVFDGTTFNVVGQFFSGSTSFRGGLRVAVEDVDATTPEPEIITVPETSGAPTARVHTLNGAELTDFKFLEPWWEGGYDVAAEPGAIVAASGPPDDARRRTTVRLLLGDLLALPLAP
jgi:hypothetical protein